MYVKFDIYTTVEILGELNQFEQLIKFKLLKEVQ